MEATGRLRYGPDAPSVPRKGYWAILECSPDWFRLYGTAAEREQPGRWVWAVDKARVFNGQHVDSSTRLGLLRNRLQAPAWGPHISITRNEEPRRHLKLWNLGVECGDLENRIHYTSWLILESYKDIQSLTRMLEATTKPRAREQIERQKNDILNSIPSLERRRQNTLLKMENAHRAWDREARAQSFPREFQPGAEIEFMADLLHPRSGNAHWWFSVSSPALRQFREAFGLPETPRLPFHLTFAVEDGAARS